MQSNLILPNDCLTALDVLNNARRKVLDKHASIKEKLLLVQPKLPCEGMQKKWKSAEKRKDKNTEMLRDKFKEARNRYSYIIIIIKDTKTRYYKAQVKECGD